MCKAVASPVNLHSGIFGVAATSALVGAARGCLWGAAWDLPLRALYKLVSRVAAATTCPGSVARARHRDSPLGVLHGLAFEGAV